jgi:tRNA(fMet)-specific endonuclease VapC
VRGYFLDTCVLSNWYKEDDRILTRTRNLTKGQPVWVSVTAWGEIEFGLRTAPPTKIDDVEEFKRFVARIAITREITQHTVPHYGQLRALLFEKFAPKGKRNKSLRPEQLVDPVTSKELGIQENDLWMAAQAMEHNFILATGDKMNRISKIAQGLVTIENWLE